MHTDLLPPYPPRRSPDLGAARVHTAVWARRVGILGAGDSWSEIWAEQDFDGFDFALFAALVHPDARGGRLDLLAGWYTWSWYLDDLILERFKRDRDLRGARVFLGRLTEMLDAGRREPRNPAERGLADLWDRTAAAGDWRDRFGSQLPNLFADALWEIGNLALGRVPEPVDYLAMRRQSGGALWAAQLVELVLELRLPLEVRDISAVRRLEEAFADVVDLHNDLVSFRRETEYEQEVSNGVVVTHAFLGTGLADAFIRTRQLLEARLELFEYLSSIEVPAALGQNKARQDVLRYLRGLRDWLAGDYQWHRETTRYQPDSWQHRTPHATLPGPRGLGTSAARLALVPGMPGS